MFIFNIEHFLSDIRGPRYLHLKKVAVAFYGFPKCQVYLLSYVVNDNIYIRNYVNNDIDNITNKNKNLANFAGWVEYCWRDPMKYTLPQFANNPSNFGTIYV